MKVDRRDFVKTGVSAGVAAGILGGAVTSAAAQGSVLGANNKIGLGVIGVGGRGNHLLSWAMETGLGANTPAQVLAVSDVYTKRLTAAKEKAKCDGYMDYRELIARKDIDAVIIATPDHWHAPMAIEAMNAGKDVYLEKPMTHTVAEAKRIYEVVQKTKRVLQVGSQTTSSDQWWKARKAIADGMIGKLIMSQGSYHRNSTEGEWNWPIDTKAGPDAKGEDFIDWKMWLGSAPACRLMRIASSASANTGTTPAASPPIFSIT
ncbi:MAG: Gfo/Idh/MocA family oxidoreductase [Pyrinomonadaceae bacterium]